MWDLRCGGACLFDVTASAAAFHPIEDTLVVIATNRYAKLFSTITYTCTGTLGMYSFPKKRTFHTCHFSPDGCFFAVVVGNDAISVFSAMVGSDVWCSNDMAAVAPVVVYKGGALSFSAFSDMLVYIQNHRICTATRRGRTWSSKSTIISTSDKYEWMQAELVGDKNERRIVACTEYPTFCAVLGLPPVAENSRCIAATPTIVLNLDNMQNAICFSRTADVFIATSPGAGTVYVWETVQKNGVDANSNGLKRRL